MTATHSSVSRVLLLALSLSVLEAAGCSGKKAAATADASGVPSLAAIIATCATATGEVQVRRAGAPYWEAAEVGVVFRAGDWVRTGKSGAARVEFLSGGGLELGPQAVVVIDAPPRKAPAAAAGAEAGSGAAGSGAPAGAEAPVVTVESGEVRGLIESSGDKPDASALAGLVLRTKDGQDVRLAPRAGREPVEVRVTRKDEGSTEVAVIKGEATLEGSDGAQQEIKAGQVSEVSGGKASAPEELIAFPLSIEPGIDARFEMKPNLTIRLAWKPVKGAQGYRVQVARDLSFRSMVVSAEIKETSYDIVPRQEGVYSWRVASRDAAGRYGEYGFARRIYYEKEQPKDLLVAPEEDTIYWFQDKSPRIAFSWQSAANAHSYLLVISAGPDLLRTARVKQRSSSQKVEVALPAGEYWWGAYVDRPIPEPVFMKPRRLVVKKHGTAKLKTVDKIDKWGE